MKLTTRLVAAATIATTFASIGYAEGHAQNYVSILGGYSGLQDIDLEGNVGGASQSVEVESDEGYNLGIAVGRQLTDLGGATLRGEVELSFSENEADEVFFSGNGPAAEINVDGELQTTRLFANVIADFDTGSAFTPYVGGGVGVSRSEFDIAYGPGVELSDESDNVSAQLILGSSYALSDTTSLFGDVRFIRDFDVETDRLAPTGALTGVVSNDVDTTNINIGVSFKF